MAAPATVSPAEASPSEPIPAKALAWMLGMVVVFVGTGFIPAQGMTWPVALLLLLFVVAAGALVGAVHGLILIWLLRQRHLRPSSL